MLIQKMFYSCTLNQNVIYCLDFTTYAFAKYKHYYTFLGRAVTFVYGKLLFPQYLYYLFNCRFVGKPDALSTATTFWNFTAYQ